MTLEELYRDKPRGEVIVTGGELNNVYKAVICHGCQSCWPSTPEGEESYPHYLSIEEITNAQPNAVEAAPGVPVAVPPVGSGT